MRRIKIFLFGFSLSAAIFVGTNIYNYQTVVPPCCDLTAKFGFPLPLGEYGGFAGFTEVYPGGLIKDALIGLGASLVFACLFTASFQMLVRSWLILSNSIVTSLSQLRTWHLRTRL